MGAMSCDLGRLQLILAATTHDAATNDVSPHGYEGPGHSTPVLGRLKRLAVPTRTFASSAAMIERRLDVRLVGFVCLPSSSSR
jgi:hypothetical protein